MDVKDVKDFIEAANIKTVIVAGTDPGGVLRGKRLTVPYFYSALEHGLNFAMFILKTTLVDDVLPGVFESGVPDIKGVPDLSATMKDIVGRCPFATVIALARSSSSRK